MNQYEYLMYSTAPTHDLDLRVRHALSFGYLMRTLAGEVDERAGHVHPSSNTTHNTKYPPSFETEFPLAAHQPSMAAVTLSDVFTAGGKVFEIVKTVRGIPAAYEALLNKKTTLEQKLGQLRPFDTSLAPLALAQWRTRAFDLINGADSCLSIYDSIPIELDRRAGMAKWATFPYTRLLRNSIEAKSLLDEIEAQLSAFDTIEQTCRDR